MNSIVNPLSIAGSLMLAYLLINNDKTDKSNNAKSDESKETVKSSIFSETSPMPTNPPKTKQTAGTETNIFKVVQDEPVPPSDSFSINLVDTQKEEEKKGGTYKPSFISPLFINF